MDNVGNEYGKPKDVVGEQRTVFTSHADAAFDVCFENVMTHCKSFCPPSSVPSSFLLFLIFYFLWEKEKGKG